MVAGNGLLFVVMSDNNNVNDEKAGAFVGDIIEIEKSLCAAELRRQKQTYKMQLTKQYTRLVRLMNQELVDREALLQGPEDYEEKRTRFWK